ncbi:MAG: glycerate kinase [Candidatus Thermoplasmatota archaeon]
MFKNRERIIENGSTPELKTVRSDVLDILNAVIEAVDPYKSVKSHFSGNILFFDEDKIDVSDFRDVYLVGFGKASVGMAEAVCDSIKIKKGVVVTNDPDASVDNKSVETVVGGHPIPDEGSVEGGKKVLGLIDKCEEDDLLVVLISGGGSALLAKPRISLEGMKKITDLLLKSGADINEINTIRKHLSKVKGGQLSKHCKGMLVSLIISDIVGDPMSFIASGPTYPDDTTFEDAKDVLEKYSLWSKIPTSAKNVIERGLKGETSDTPNTDSEVFENVFNYIVANNSIACEAAKNKAKELDYTPMLLTSSLEGEAREMGIYIVDKAQTPINKDTMTLISGGETTVTIKGDGKGGRNQEMVLSVVGKIFGENIVFASFGTDGIDGDSDAAGAIADGFTLSRATEKGLDPKKYLENNDSYNFFKPLDDLLLTGPTGTNVMDVQLIVKNF